MVSRIGAIQGRKKELDSETLALCKPNFVAKDDSFIQEGVYFGAAFFSSEKVSLDPEIRAFQLE